MMANDRTIFRQIYETLEFTSTSEKTRKIVGVPLMILISLNVIAVILETVESLALNYAIFFKYFEIVSIIIFTGEYILRLGTCLVDPRYVGPLRGRLRYVASPMALIDLMAIMPFYLPLLFPFDLRVVRALRLLRLFRLFKLGRYSDALRIIGSVLKKKREELFISLFVVIVLLILCSSLMYYVEHETQPEDFSSIPATMWWGIATLTTVGYGDISPATALGKFLGGVIALLGIGMFALPAGILASGFAEAIQKRNNPHCPHCGGVLDEGG